MIDFLLLQINDTSFPIGSYTHSFGLETYIQQGLINNKEQALKYVKAVLNTQILYTDLLSIKLIYKAKNLEEILKLESIMNAGIHARESREGMQKIGARFIKAIKSIQFNNDMFYIYTSKSKYHTHSSAYAVFCKTQNIQFSDAIKHYLFSQTSNIVTNCVKLIPLSQYDGQYILALLYKDLEQIYNKLQILDVEDFCNVGVNYDIKSMQHEVLHSRLYMS